MIPGIKRSFRLLVESRAKWLGGYCSKQSEGAAWTRVEAAKVVKSGWILNITTTTSYIACHFKTDLVTLFSNFLALDFSICFSN